MHQGIVKTKQFLRACFFWPGMDQAVEAMIRGCSACVLKQPLRLGHGTLAQLFVWCEVYFIVYDGVILRGNRIATP